MKYAYTDLKLLNRLVDMIDTETGKHANILMRPDIPEFLKRREDFCKMSSNEYELTMDRLGIDRDCALMVNYPIHSGRPRIESARMNRPRYWEDEEKAIGNNWPPLDVFFRDKKFLWIKFEDFGTMSVASVQRAVRLAVGNGYIVDWISMGLNPRSYTPDHYYDGVDYSAHLERAGRVNSPGSA